MRSTEMASLIPARAYMRALDPGEILRVVAPDRSDDFVHADHGPFNSAVSRPWHPEQATRQSAADEADLLVGRRERAAARPHSPSPAHASRHSRAARDTRCWPPSSVTTLAANRI